MNDLAREISKLIPIVFFGGAWLIILAVVYWVVRRSRRRAAPKSGRLTPLRKAIILHAIFRR